MALDLCKSKKDGKDQETIQSIPQLTQYTTWESNKNTINITNKCQEVSPFPAGDHKAIQDIEDIQGKE